MKSSFLFRSKIVILCVFIFAAALFFKIFLLQVVHGSFYASAALRQYATPASNIYERGSIFFETKNGELVSAATQTTGFKLAIDPSKLLSLGATVDLEEVYKKISGVIALDRDEFLERAGKADDPYEEIASRLSKEEADALSLLKIPGVNIFKEKWRFYPGTNLAAHAVGLVAYKGVELAGRYGLEREYDETLARSADAPYVNFFAEVFSNINKNLFKNEKREGDVVSTIEPVVQGFLERKLSEVKEKYHADSIGGIIMDPVDGAMYALGAKPDFNPNDFSGEKVSVFANPLVENVLEFGSVVKPLVMASAIDAGAVTAETKYTDRGSILVEKKEIFNFDKKARGLVDMQEVLNQSLNTGMVFVSERLGREKMRDYLLSFGIRDKAGIDLPNETAGLVSNIIESPREIEYANAAFGQGIALTPVALVRALAALANGGNLVVPHVVRGVKYNDGSFEEKKYDVIRSRISQATSEEITRMLVVVMDKAIKSGIGKLEHFSLAVKTGTAQVANNETGGYYEDRHTHSFFGYFPAYAPKFLVFLYAVNPKGIQYAAQTWSDPFLDIAKFLLNYYQIPPDR